MVLVMARRLKRAFTLLTQAFQETSRARKMKSTISVASIVLRLLMSEVMLLMWAEINDRSGVSMYFCILRACAKLLRNVEL